MGTNYFLHKDTCEHCGRSDEPIHIGKSSIGWHFSLHVIPEGGINNLVDWIGKFHSDRAIIKNEYNESITIGDMVDTITNRSFEGKPMTSDDLRKNHAEYGLNGLLRHKLGCHCIGHGDGTYDYIVGEFS